MSVRFLTSASAVNRVGQVMTLAASELGKNREAAQIVSSTSRLMGKNDHDMDQEARDEAKAVTADLKAHKDVCAILAKQNADALSRLEAAISALQKKMDDRIGKIPAGIIAVMGTVIGFLAARVWPAH